MVIYITEDSAQEPYRYPFKYLNYFSSIET